MLNEASEGLAHFEEVRQESKWRNEIQLRMQSFVANGWLQIDGCIHWTVLGFCADRSAPGFPDVFAAV